MANDPITNILEKMETMILSMDVPEYNYKWGAVNDLDQAELSQPTAVIYIDPGHASDEALGETNASEETLNIRIDIRIDSDTLDNSIWSYKPLNQAFQDLRRLFNTENQSLCCEAFTIEYKNFIDIDTPQNDVLRPKKRKTYWTIKYLMDKTSGELRP